MTADHSIRGIVHIKNDGELIIGAFVEIVDGKEEVI